MEAPPAVLSGGELNYVTGVGKLAGRLIVLLDMNKLLEPGEPAGKSESVEKKAAAKPEARGAAARWRDGKTSCRILSSA